MTKRILSLVLICCLLLAVMTACGQTPADKPSSDTSEASAPVSEDESSDDGIIDLPDDIFDPVSGDTTSAAGTTAGKTEATKAGSKTTAKTTTAAKKTQPTYAKTQPTYAKIEDAELAKLPQYEQDAYKLMPDLKTDSEKKVTILFRADMGHSRVLAHKYGIVEETVVVPFGEELTRYISMVNGGTPPDIYIGNFSFTMISKKYVQAWDSYTNLSDSMWKDEKPHMDNFAVGGKHYMFIPKDPTSAGKIMYVLYNADVIKNAGLQTPSELFAQNKWDWDAFINIAKKLTDSQNKKFGAWLYNGPAAFIYSTGHDYIDFVNGKAQNMVKSAPVARAVQAYSNLIANKSVYGGANSEVLVGRGDVAMSVTTIGGVMACKDQILKGSCGFTAFPKDPQSDFYAMPYESNGFYLAKGAKHPYNAVAYMVNWHFANSKEYRKGENRQDIKDGIDTYPAEIFDTAAAIDEKVKGTMMTWASFGNEVGVYASAIGSALSAGEPWSKIAAEFSPVVDEGIKNFYGG